MGQDASRGIAEEIKSRLETRERRREQLIKERTTRNLLSGLLGNLDENL